MSPALSSNAAILCAQTIAAVLASLPPGERYAVTAGGSESVAIESAYWRLSINIGSKLMLRLMGEKPTKGDPVSDSQLAQFGVILPSQ